MHGEAGLASDTLAEDRSVPLLGYVERAAPDPDERHACGDHVAERRAATPRVPSVHSGRSELHAPERVEAFGDAHRARLDLHDVGELTPAVAALCALADSPSHLRGVAHIRGHETDRITALATELGRLGAEVTEREDGLSITPAPLHGGVFRTYADHRMAHAGVVVGACVDDVLVEDVATTGKTFPDFAAFWSTLF